MKLINFTHPDHPICAFLTESGYGYENFPIEVTEVTDPSTTEDGIVVDNQGKFLVQAESKMPVSVFWFIVQQ